MIAQNVIVFKTVIILT